MPKGGARVNSGPPPDPNALRRDRRQDRDGWTTLPAEGRTGEPPTWPLDDLPLDGEADVDYRGRELKVWRDIWATPQAVAWERLGWTHDVALYVRLLVIGERGDVKALSESRQWSDRLGLNPAAMLRNRWRVASDEVAAQRASREGDDEDAALREQLKVLDGGAN